MNRFPPIPKDISIVLQVEHVMMAAFCFIRVSFFLINISAEGIHFPPKQLRFSFPGRDLPFFFFLLDDAPTPVGNAARPPPWEGRRSSPLFFFFFRSYKTPSRRRWSASWPPGPSFFFPCDVNGSRFCVGAVFSGDDLFCRRFPFFFQASRFSPLFFLPLPLHKRRCRPGNSSVEVRSPPSFGSRFGAPPPPPPGSSYPQEIKEIYKRDGRISPPSFFFFSLPNSMVRCRSFFSRAKFSWRSVGSHFPPDRMMEAPPPIPFFLS